jgi:hypothetical protein
VDRLRPIPFRIQEILLGLRKQQLRRITIFACETAVQGASLHESFVDVALKKVGLGELDLELSQNLQKLVDALDAVYFNRQELQEAGEGSESQVLEAFSKARAANAVLAGLNTNTQVAAAEATYEAYHALGGSEVFLDQIALHAR